MTDVMTRLAALAGLLLLPALALAQPSVHSFEFEPIGIPDADPEGVAITLSVEGVSGVINHAVVAFPGRGPSRAVLEDANAALVHPAVGDLKMTLTSPTGTTVTLLDRPPVFGTDRNLSGTYLHDTAMTSIQRAPGSGAFAGGFLPMQALAAFEGENANGTWTLEIADLEPGDMGALRRVTLMFCTSESPCVFPAVLEVTTPAIDQTVPFERASRVVNVIASESLEFLQYRVLPPGSNGTGIPWITLITGDDDNTRWSATIALAVGENVVQTRGLGPDGTQTAVVARRIRRDDRVYNGPRPDFAMLAADGRIDVALSRPVFQGNPTTWIFGTGFAWNPLTGAFVAPGDFDGDGLDDVISISPEGEVTVTYNTGLSSFIGLVGGPDGFLFDEYEGYGIFIGDFTANGRADVLQITPDGEAFVGWNQGGVPAPPVSVGTIALPFDPYAGFWMDVADVTGDGRDDIVAINPDGVLRVAVANGTGFNPPTTWRATQFFRYNRGTPSAPLDGRGIFLGDVNGDGRADVVHTDHIGRIWVARSTGGSFAAPALWGDYPFYYAPFFGLGVHMFVADLTGNAMADMVQLTHNGEFIVAPSTGHRFKQPTYVYGTPPFHSEILGPRRVMLGEFGN